MPTHHQTGPLQQINRLRGTLGTSLRRLAEGCERHPAIGLVLILLIYSMSTLGYSLTSPLWHDELFTFYIAQAPSLHDLLVQNQTIDLNPPLSYVLTRASFKLFGVGTLQCRLPEILGFGVALISLFSFVGRRAGNTYGLLAAAFLLAGKAADPVIQARPYGLMLGLGALTLWLWQSSTHQPNISRARLLDILLFLSTCLLLLDHVFGVFIWAAVVAGELTQTALRRRLAPVRSFALFAPLALTALYRPLISNHGASAFPTEFQPSPNTIFEFYIAHIDRELVCLLLTALVIVLAVGPSWLRGSQRRTLALPECVAVSGLIAIPLELIASSIHQHSSFFERYGIAASLGISILSAALLYRWSAGNPAAAMIAAALALLISGRIPDAIGAATAGDIFRRTSPILTPSGLETAVPADLPLVDASGLTFLEMSQREPPALLDRTFYLTGGPSAITYANATIFEGMSREAKAFRLRAHAASYTDFIQQHTHFYVFGTYDYPEDWLLRKLLADGASLRLVQHQQTSYKDRDLYEITLPPNPGLDQSQPGK